MRWVGEKERVERGGSEKRSRGLEDGGWVRWVGERGGVREREERVRMGRGWCSNPQSVMIMMHFYFHPLPFDNQTL